MGKFGSKKSKFWFCLKIGIHGISKMMIFIDISFLNFQSWICFWANLGQKKSKLSVLPENGHTEYGENADSYSDINFLNFQSYIHFWANLGRKSQNNYIYDFIVCVQRSYLTVERLTIAEWRTTLMVTGPFLAIYCVR